MKKATLLVLAFSPIIVLGTLWVSMQGRGPGEKALATVIAQLPTSTKTEPTTTFTPVLPETCIMPPQDNPPKVTIGREGHNGQLIDCALKAFRELFPGCGNPAANPGDFSLQLYEAWLAANGYKVDELPDNDGDGIVDPIVHPNQVLVGYWKGGWWTETE